MPIGMPMIVMHTSTAATGNVTAAARPMPAERSTATTFGSVTWRSTGNSHSNSSARHEQPRRGG